MQPTSSPIHYRLYATRLLVPRMVALACVVGLLLSLATPALAQDNITFTASVDRNTLTTDDVLTLQLTLKGTFRSNSDPQIPPLEGFQVVGTSQSSQFSIVNGAVSSQVTFIYRLQPTKVGELTIPAISIQVAKQSYETEPVIINVTQGAAPQAQAPTTEAPRDSTTPRQLAGQDLYVEAGVDNATPVIGEQIIYIFRLYQAVNLFNQPELNWPDFTGFMSYDLSPNNQYYQQVAGREYLVTEVRRALFPTAQGTVSIGPSTLIIPGDFFNRTVELETEAIPVDIQALPGKAPAEFSGAVGQFEIEAWVEPTEGRVNEPITLFVRISGTGNINAIPDPTEGTEVNLSNWRIYDPQVSTDIGQEDNTIQGTKRVERLLVPKVAGTLSIPSFKLTFFDPETEAYRSIETAPLSVSVAPGEAEAPGPVMIGNGKQDVILLGSDIRHIKAAPPTLTVEHTSLLGQPLYWLGWAFPLLATVGAWLWKQRQRTLKQDVAYARRQRARRLARKRLGEAHKLAQSNEDAAYAAVARALSHYLGDKFNLPAASLTRDTIQQTLTAQAIPETIVDRLLACLDWADSGRFAPVAAGRDASALVREAEEIIADLEEAT